MSGVKKSKRHPYNNVRLWLRYFLKLRFFWKKRYFLKHLFRPKLRGFLKNNELGKTKQFYLKTHLKQSWMVENIPMVAGSLVFYPTATTDDMKISSKYCRFLGNLFWCAKTYLTNRKSVSSVKMAKIVENCLIKNLRLPTLPARHLDSIQEFRNQQLFLLFWFCVLYS